MNTEGRQCNTVVYVQIMIIIEKRKKKERKMKEKDKKNWKDRIKKEQKN